MLAERDAADESVGIPPHEVPESDSSSKLLVPSCSSLNRHKTLGSNGSRLRMISKLSWIRLAGAACILFALIANPWVLERWVVLDSHVDRLWRILTAQGALLALGLWLLLRAPSGPPSPGGSLLGSAVTFALASLFSLGAAEIALRSLATPPLVLDGDAWFEYNWRSSRGEGEGLYYTYDRFDLDLGWRPVPDYDRDGIRTNALGIRAEREYSFERTPGVARIVVLGDSFTWGEKTWGGEIANAETYAALLERMHPRLEVLNLGVHGYGTDQQYLYLGSLGLRFRPDLLILGFFEHNMVRNGQVFFGYAKPRFVLIDGDLVLTHTPVPTPEQILAEPFAFPRSYLMSLFRKVSNSVLDRTKLRPIETRPDWRVTRALFESAKRDSEQAGADFLLVLIPAEVTSYATAVERAVVDWSIETDTHLLNLREAFAARPEAEWATFYDGHWTRDGHAVVADAIWEKISTAGLLPTESAASPKWMKR